MAHHVEAAKVVQAAAAITRREGGQAIDRLRLVKLLYIADRRAIQERGMPLLGSRLVAMKNGPLHSEVLDLLNGRHVEEPLWSAHFESDGYKVLLRNDPGVGLLSKQEIDLLNETVDRFLAESNWDVVEHTHEFEEWRKNYPNPSESTSREIPLADVIEAVGRHRDKEAILQDAQDKESYDQFFSSASP